MTQSLGARLRQQREQRQITIATIAAETKINPTLLHGLERDDVSQWPQGIFRRAYIRAYASAIGLDPETVSREFLELYPDSVIVLPAGAAAIWPEQRPEAERGDGAAPEARPLRRLLTSATSVVPAVFRRPRPEPATPEPRASARPEPDLTAIARLCSRLAQATDRAAVEAAMEEAAALLDVVGLIVWTGDGQAAALAPALVLGYRDDVRSRLSAVPADADNAVGISYRSREMRIVDGDGVTGAVAVPILGARRCLGVLALEVPHGGERRESLHALALLLAAQLASAGIPILTRSAAPGPRRREAGGRMP